MVQYGLKFVKCCKKYALNLWCEMGNCCCPPSSPKDLVLSDKEYDARALYESGSEVPSPARSRRSTINLNPLTHRFKKLIEHASEPRMVPNKKPRFVFGITRTWRFVKKKKRQLNRSSRYQKGELFKFEVPIATRHPMPPFPPVRATTRSAPCIGV